MLISILFSVAIYNITLHEVDTRLRHFQNLIEGDNAMPPENNGPMFRSQESDDASASILIRLYYINLGVLIFGTAGSYFLARRTLRPVEQAHEAQVRFTSDASHELRTPLAIMKSELEVNLRDSNLSESEMREILESNLEEVENLSRLSEMLLALSKQDYDKLPKTQFDLLPVAQDALKRFKKPTKRLILRDSPSAPITANKESVKELLAILVENALKYSPDDSQVSVQIFKKDQKTHFEVSNEGNGIDEVTLDHIFDRFYRGDTSRTGGEKKGFGLGLSIAKHISELNNGVITASSAAGQTTTFTFVI